jgi:hypothetical protein
MTIAKTFVGKRIVLALAIAGVWFCISPNQMLAQEGQNAVYNNGKPTGSTAFVDASAWCGTTGGSSNCYIGQNGKNVFDFCGALGSALSAVLIAGGGVVDARGVVAPPGVPAGGGGGSQQCNENPFGSIASNNDLPILVLLPASKIEIGKATSSWTLPSNVHLLGEGEYTVLQAEYSSGDIIDMGPSGCTTPVTGISVEHLNVEVDLSNYPTNTVNGIVNNCAQQSSYVDNVEVGGIGGIGIQVTSNAQNSGPYSNIYFGAADVTPSSCASNSSLTCPACIDIEAQTRGVHGATCLGGPTDVPEAAAIYVNASNNTVEDVHVEAFWDGVEVGDIAQAVGNVVISNVNGGFGSNGYVMNIVHICGPNAPNNGALGTCNVKSGTVTDVAIVDSTDASDGGADSLASTVVEDDVTSTSVTPPQPPTNLPPPTYATTGEAIGMYVLGEPVSGGTSPGYSRFTTNPGTNFTVAPSGSPVATWGVGNAAPGSSCAPNPNGTSGSVPGAVYSNTAGNGGSNSPNSIYVCTTSGTWAPIL